jgi:hypothetical protein
VYITLENRQMRRNSIITCDNDGHQTKYHVIDFNERDDWIRYQWIKDDKLEEANHSYKSTMENVREGRWRLKLMPKNKHEGSVLKFNFISEDTCITEEK